MTRETGTYSVKTMNGESVRAFVPHPLPPSAPPLEMAGALAAGHTAALVALAQLRGAGTVVPDPDWFLYGFVRKEAVLSSQIEGTDATIGDVAAFEATSTSDRPDDVEEVCNYVEALNYARAAIADPSGLPLSTRLICDAHRILMRGTRGQEKLPGEVRRSQNWIGGTRPGNARFVPPPHEEVAPALAALERWIHSDDPLPPLVKAGLAHVQFETIHPFLDGNGRIGRLLIALLLEHWGLLNRPLLYLSVSFKRRQAEYYARLAAVRTAGDWEGWLGFFFECVAEAAYDAVDVSARLYKIVTGDRAQVLASGAATLNTFRLLEALPVHPVVTLSRAIDLLAVAKPTAIRCIDELVAAGILRETSGRQRDRVYAYHAYLRALTGDEG